MSSAKYRHTWIVFYGPRHSCKVFRTEYHAEQFLRALELNGTECQLVNGREQMNGHAELTAHDFN